MLPQAYTYFGPPCPVPGYRSLDASAIAGVAAVRAPLPAATVINVQPPVGFTLASQVQSGL